MGLKFYALALVALAACAPCAAQTNPDAAARVKKIIKDLDSGLKDLRTKPRALKPGEAAGLNPQPEPPGRQASKMNTNVSTKPATVTPGTAGSLNPQPEPPGKPNPGEAGALNPQPEPPNKQGAGLKPGEASALNPQPEPPGSPAPTLAKMRDALASLQTEAKSLSLAPDSRAKFDAKLSDARSALDHYEKAADVKAANAALDDFSKALGLMSKLAEAAVGH